MSKGKRCFILNIGPTSLVAKYKAAQAANNFSFNLIDGGAFDKSYSVVPPFIYDDDIKHNTDEKIEYLSGSPNLPMLLKKVYALLLNIVCAIKARKYDNIWFYNIGPGNVLCFLLLKYIFRKSVFAILLDYTPEPSKLKLQHYYLGLLEKANGIISLTGRVELINQNKIVKAGVMSVEKIRPFYLRQKKSKPVFLFCGNLRALAGYPLLIKVFSELPDVELYITGKNPAIEVDFSNFPNIHYINKYLEYEDFLEVYNKVDVCLSFRDPSYPENMYNFPSKIIEFFSFNKIVLSTIYYPELESFKYLWCEFDKDAIKRSILKIFNWDNNTINYYSDNREELIKHFSVESWISAFETIEAQRK